MVAPPHSALQLVPQQQSGMRWRIECGCSADVTVFCTQAATIATQQQLCLNMNADFAGVSPDNTEILQSIPKAKESIVTVESRPSDAQVALDLGRLLFTHVMDYATGTSGTRLSICLCSRVQKGMVRSSVGVQPRILVAGVVAGMFASVWITRLEHNPDCDGCTFITL